MRKPFIFKMISLGCVASAAAPLSAQSLVLHPLVDARLRYERVEQDGVQHDADALTIRVRSGLKAERGRLSVLAEAEATLAIVGHYDDLLSGPSRYASVGDPQDVALYRAQLQYASKPLTATVGRQRIALDDERFVGIANWRQNGRTYDAFRIESGVLPGVKADLSYAWSIRTPNGIAGSGAKPAAIGGDNIFAHLAWKAPLGTLAGFAYLIDQDEAAVQGYRLSSQSYGVRWTGDYKAAPGIKAAWILSYAKQSDYHRNPNHYRADYYLGELNLDVSAARLGVGYEVLGASRGVALTSFQTPLSSAFRFQGWADKFTTTPPNGVRDLYGSVGWTWKSMGPLRDVLVQAVHHRFDSDRLGMRYGVETDLLASTKWRRYTLSARFADYHASSFATDTRKIWLEVDYSI